MVTIMDELIMEEGVNELRQSYHEKENEKNSNETDPAPPHADTHYSEPDEEEDDYSEVFESQKEDDQKEDDVEVHLLLDSAVELVMVTIMDELIMVEECVNQFIAVESGIDLMAEEALAVGESLLLEKMLIHAMEVAVDDIVDNAVHLATEIVVDTTVCEMTSEVIHHGQVLEAFVSVFADTLVNEVVEEEAREVYYEASEGVTYTTTLLLIDEVNP